MYPRVIFTHTLSITLGESFGSNLKFIFRCPSPISSYYVNSEYSYPLFAFIHFWGVTCTLLQFQIQVYIFTNTILVLCALLTTCFMLRHYMWITFVLSEIINMVQADLNIG